LLGHAGPLASAELTAMVPTITSEVAATIPIAARTSILLYIIRN
jgi:hypothetical protein